MGKEHVHTQVIPYCTVKDFFEILYADGAAAREFHRVADKDENAQVEEWVGNTRTVHFTMPMQLPAVIAKLIGSNTIPVKEVQVAETASDGTLHIVSTPTIGVPGGSRFQAVARLTVSSTVTCRGSFGCKVVAKVTCTADGPWGLQGMIEGIMIDQSAATVQVYLDFCRARCQAVCSKQVVDGLGSPRSDTSGVEHFFDAQEILSRQLSGVSSSGLSLGPSTAEIIDTVALLRLLDTLDGRLMLLSSDVAEMRALIPPDMPPSSTPPARRELGHRFGSWLMGFACGAAVVSAIAFIIRHRHAATRF